MIVKLGDLNKEKHSTAVYIRRLQALGKIRKLIDEDGYLCYETSDLEDYKKNIRRGRPYKIKENDNVIRVTRKRGRPRKDNTNNQDNGGENE